MADWLSALPTAEGFPGWLWQTGKRGPPDRCGEPMLWQRLPLEARGRQKKKPQKTFWLSKTFPSPCCYPRALSWLKQSLKTGSCQPGRKGKLSAKPFSFGSVLLNHFKFSLCKMWDIAVHIQIKRGLWSPMALPWDKIPFPALANSRSQNKFCFSLPPRVNPTHMTTTLFRVFCHLKCIVLPVRFSSIPDNIYFMQVSDFLAQNMRPSTHKSPLVWKFMVGTGAGMCF